MVLIVTVVPRILQVPRVHVYDGRDVVSQMLIGCQSGDG